jgi:hypothetical protein
MGKLPSETRNSRGRVLTLRAAESVARAQSPKLTLQLSYDAKTHKLGENVGGKAIGTFAADTRLLAVTQEGHLRVFTASFLQKLPGPLHSCLPLPQDAILSVISRRRHDELLLARRLKTEDWGDGSEFQLSELRDHTIVGLSFADDPLLRLTFKGEQGPPEIIALADWTSCKAAHATPTRITRPGLDTAMLLT